MSWPWVSRELFEETKRQLEASEKERTRLLDLLLGAGGRPAPTREPSHAPAPQTAPVKATVDVAVDDGIRPVTEKKDDGDSAGAGNPFDRVLTRFDHNFGPGKTPPAAFKARIH
jgi:hypothetical protein